jgi:predicted aspartyl protease
VVALLFLEVSKVERLKKLLSGTAMGLVIGLAAQGQSSASDAGRRVIASARIDDEQCHIAGFANGAAFRFVIDTGVPGVAAFSSSDVRRLGLNGGTLRYEQIWPGTRYGKSANVTLREIRIGDVVWQNEQVDIFSNWRFAFGDNESPLLGLGALKSQGVHLEVDGDTCRLTVASSSAPAQCGDYKLSKMRGDETLRLCESECSAVPFCRRLTER